MLVPSGADSAVYLQNTVFGDENVFIDKMNEKAQEIGMYNTHFSNVTGLDDENNYSTIEDVAKSSFWLLKDTGSLFLINRPDRLSDTIIALNNNKLYPKYIRFILPSQNERPTMFLMQAVKSSKTQLTIMENLVVYKSKGIYSDEVSKIYNLI